MKAGVPKPLTTADLLAAAAAAQADDQGMVRHRPQPRALLQPGRHLRRHSQVPEADVNDAHFQRGSLLYQQGRYADAIGELQLQLAAGETFLTHSLLALCLAQLEKFPEAMEHVQRAIHLAPDESFGHYALAQVMLHRNRFDEASAAIEEAIRLDPFDADYFAILGSIELRHSRWREALAAADQGLAIDPEHQLLTNLRAQALVKLGDRAAAAATIGEALARRPDDPYTHANQGWALLHAGQPHQALEHFREALRLNPELEWARIGIVEALKARNFRLSLDAGLFPVDGPAAAAGAVGAGDRRRSSPTS